MKRVRLNTYFSKLDVMNIKPLWFLLAGVITMTVSHMTFSIDIVAWFSMVPFLIYLSITKGWRSKLIFTLALIVAWSIIVFKIITPPIPYMLIFLYSVPISLIQLPGYLFWAKFRDRRFSALFFPAMMVLLEWIQYTFTPLGSWGVAAYTQTSSIDILQFLSLFGMAGLSFLIYWVNLAITTIIVKREHSFLTSTLPLSILVFVILFGTLRFEISKSKSASTITVAAIGTDSEIGGLPLPEGNKNENDIEYILQRTKTAADFGAKIIVWTEGSFYLEPDNETSWIHLFQAVANEKNINLIASYILLLSESPFAYENKYLMIDSMGNINHTYFKHQPVPGEPAIKGTDPLQTIKVDETSLGGVICYDYDFPYLAKEYGNINADIVAVPSSDWRGIDPLHSRMAAYRAIEQGHSLIRSTRFGLSAAINPYGEMLSQMSSFHDNNKIMISQLPVNGIKTVYSVIGDILVYLCIGFIMFFFIIKRQL